MKEFLKREFSRQQCFVNKTKKSVAAALCSTMIGLNLTSFDVSGLDRALAAGEKHIEDVCDYWRNDTRKLLEVVKFAIPSGWTTLLEHIFDDEEKCKALSKTLVTDQTTTNRALNGCVLLRSWLKLFNQINNDGYGAKFEIGLLAEMEKVANEGNHYGDVAHAMRMLQIDLPAIKNNMIRKRRVCEHLKANKNNTWGKAINAEFLKMTTVVDSPVKEKPADEKDVD
jgi:hypothetical protein